ncbi:MAG: type II toxin-antitoxin system VapC family toxin [Planctomycetaceae bacterium]
MLDASVAVKWAITEADSAQAIQLRDDYRNGIYDLIVPDVFPVEVAHALTRAERQGRLAVGDTAAYMVNIIDGLPRVVASLSLLPRAVELSSQARIGVYDCLYVALAEREGCALVTADDRLVRTFSGGFVVPLSAL